jgi:SPP1 gp7 family putative phage head morphogenesis protein
LATNSACGFFRPSPLTIKKRLAGLKGIELKELHAQLQELYTPCCDIHFPLSTGEGRGEAFPDLVDDGLINFIIQKVYKSQGTFTESTELTAAIFNDLWKGVQEGLGEADYETPDQAFIDALRANVSQFSSAKDYTMLREMNAALLDENGTLLTWEAFKEAALKISGEYLKNYLKVEYNLAVAGAQMAAKWKNILSNANALPLLKFDAVIDNRTSEICRPLDGIILPIDHLFWKRFYPPNHYGCRSTVQQLASGVVTADNKIASVEIPAMFQTNLGERTLIFPPDHPYFVR